jgi:hypothetical protein
MNPSVGISDAKQKWEFHPLISDRYIPVPLVRPLVRNRFAPVPSLRRAGNRQRIPIPRGQPEFFEMTFNANKLTIFNASESYLDGEWLCIVSPPSSIGGYPPEVRCRRSDAQAGFSLPARAIE